MKKTIFMLLLAVSLTSCGKAEDKKVVTYDFSEDAYGSKDIENLTLQFGDALDVIQNENNVIIKAKITPNVTNEKTISQNYHNVVYLIQNNGFNTCDELKYWAVADMTNGEENKVISFTVPKEIIDGIYEDKIYATQLPDLVKDLWIHPSLTK